jgi:Flp pilus assembly protein TadD
LLLEGDRSLEPAAWARLSDMKDAIADDKEALDALGNLAVERGDFQTAERAFRAALKVDPVDLTAASNLGTLVAKQGRIDEAISLMRPAFERNRDVSGLAMNLARVECAAGEGAAASETLRSTLVYNPGLDVVEQLLKQMNDCAPPAGRK